MVQYRLACPADAEALSVVRQRSWTDAYRGIYPDAMIDQYDYESHARQFLRQMEQTDREIYVVEDGARVIGYFSIGTADWYRDIPVCLHSLYLLPEYHRRGIGTHIMKVAADWCRQRGYSTFFNSCNPHNRKAMAFYKAMGGILGEMDDGYDDPGADQCYYEYTVTESLAIYR